MANRRALCVGINDYKNFPEMGLNGCVNDAHQMSRVLRSHLGFGPREVTTLQDAGATKASIMDHLQFHVREALAGRCNYLVFTLSSHGAQIPDTTGKESDGLTEVFVPHDAAWSEATQTATNMILDDELRALFVKLPRHVLLEVYLDTCHSGTGIRAALFSGSPGAHPPARKKRYLPLRRTATPRPVAPTPTAGQVPSLKMARLLARYNVRHHILWAACEDWDVSEEATFNGVSNGAFTYNFCDVVRANPRLPRKEILNRVRAGLQSQFFGQIPQLELEATRNTAIA